MREEAEGGKIKITKESEQKVEEHNWDYKIASEDYEYKFTAESGCGS